MFITDQYSVITDQITDKYFENFIKVSAHRATEA